MADEPRKCARCDATGQIVVEVNDYDEYTDRAVSYRDVDVCPACNGEGYLFDDENTETIDGAE